MAGNVEVKVLGVEELAAATKDLNRRIEHDAPDAFQRVGADVAAAVQARVPRLTGRLAASVRAERTQDGVGVVMGDNVPYAVFVEHGGRGFPHSATGNYLYPTAMDAGPALERAGLQTAEQAIERTSWPNPM